MLWDLVIVTARTAQQRWLFERYLGQLWPAPVAGKPRYRVLQDPSGPQLGTAAATVHALCAAAQQLRDQLPRSRVLILHCGGLSQRVPQLSHLGKAFAPGAAREGDGTLFVQIVAELDRLFREMEPGAVIACGDVFYTAPALGVACRRDEVVAVACRASPEQGSRHGVYLWASGSDRVSGSWQKPPAQQLRALTADQPWGLDTGILFLGSRAVELLLRVAAVGAGETAPAGFLRKKQEWRGVELYRDLTPPMTSSWDQTTRLPGAPGEVQRALSRLALRIACPEPAEMLHFGTNEELMPLLGDGGAARIYSSYIAHGEIAPGAVLDRCLAEPPISVGEGSYVSGLSRAHRELAIAGGRIAYQVPIRRSCAGGSAAFITIGVQDDAKHPLERGATLLGEPLTAWLGELELSSQEVWEGVPGPERSLWNARLFPIGDGESVAEAVPWLSGTADGQFGERVDRWRAHPRTSMAEANRLFDARRWWTHEQRIRAHCFAARLEAAVRQGEGSRVGELLRSPGVTEAGIKLARRRLRKLGLSESASLTGARAWLVASALSSPPASPLRERSFQSLSRALVGTRSASTFELIWQIAPGEVVEAQAPVRVDLAGGWTDTPPQACERGGAVLNLALRLEGRRPIAARVERLAEPVVELVSEDLGCSMTLTAVPSARRRLDPRHRFGIHLGALQLIGLLPNWAHPDRLRQLGGGLRLTTTAPVPQGSGLGTSSILGVVVLAALGHAFGHRQSLNELCRGVLCLEQLMGTGGGWQDPIGGMWGGAKFAQSGPGLEQSPEVERLAMSQAVQEGLAQRMVLFYTGEPRLARDVLQRVVGSYFLGDPTTIRILDEMPCLAQQARTALIGGDWEGLGRCIARSWELNQQLEPTCSNPTLAALFGRIAPLVLGAKLAGAGGGGFLFALARDQEARQRLESLLAAVPPPARLYTAVLDLDGISVVRHARPSATDAGRGGWAG